MTTQKVRPWLPLQKCPRDPDKVYWIKSPDRGTFTAKPAAGGKWYIEGLGAILGNFTHYKEYI